MYPDTRRQTCFDVCLWQERNGPGGACLIQLKTKVNVGGFNALQLELNVNHNISSLSNALSPQTDSLLFI